MENIYAERIEALRTMMAARGWDAVILTGSDPHQSEYPATRWKQVEWLTGFTGEAGDVVVTDTHAGLWTDTRYFIQAARQLEGTGVQLHKMRVPEQVSIPEWLGSTFPDGAVVAVDSLCQSAEAVDGLKTAFDVACVADIISPLWKDRPAIPQTPVCRVKTGESRISKIAWLRQEMAEAGCDACLVSALDDVAWMLNVRADDIEYNPLVISYLLVDRRTVRWYVTKTEDTDPGTEDTFDTLRDEDIEVLPYEDISRDLATMYCECLLLDSGSINAELRESVSCPYKAAPSVIAPRKAVKNTFELESMREVHADDGAAVEKFLYWLEKSVESGRRVTERDAATRLGQLREEIPDYRGDSFETISAYGPSAALPHYITPSAADAPVIEPHGLYLCDSGGQYLRGTTDITRTIPVGECTDEEKLDYTLVLKGHIGLEMAVFPSGTPGCRIDALARMPLWRHRRNFGHGTGHGVGFFLGVHEGPQDIRQNLNGTPLVEGMVVSDEPGIYREGLYGIRHENLVECVEDGTGEFGTFLRFEPLTLCHFDTSCVIRSLLTDEEAAWLNAYNAKVRDTLSPLLPPEIANWLKTKTTEI